MAQETASGVLMISSTSSVRETPFGVSRSMVRFSWPVRSIQAAAFAAAAAQEPVV
jgi:hypothetical protein